MHSPGHLQKSRVGYVLFYVQFMRRPSRNSFNRVFLAVDNRVIKQHKFAGLSGKEKQS